MKIAAKMRCWKCEREMRRVKDDFHGFAVKGWKCSACAEIVYDADSINPVLEHNKLKAYLYDLSDSVTIDKAIAEARKRWIK